MKITNIILGRAVRLLTISNVGAGPIYGVNLTRALETRYGFLEGPRVLADYDFSKGITFRHGYFRSMVIDVLQIFGDGVLVEAKLNTDVCEAFVDDALEWIKQNAGVQAVPKVGAPKFFGSNLEIESDISLPLQLKAAGDFASEMIKTLQSYGQTTPQYELSGIAFSAPIGATTPFWQPAAFKFERREGSAAQSNRYFSLSSMRTDDHIKALRALEALLRGASASPPPSEQSPPAASS